MNKARRDALEKLMLKIEEVVSELETLKDEEDEYRENMPENLQGGTRYEESEAASEYMDYALDNLNEAMGNINESMGE